MVCTRARPGESPQPVAILHLEPLAREPLAPADWLHPVEQRTYDAQTRRTRQREFLHGRMLAKRGLAALGVATRAPEMAIQPGCFGQPLVAGDGLHGHGISISHAGPAWVGALAFREQVPMGLDIELISQRPGRALATRLTATEHALIANQGEWGATALWAAKEALAKLLRTGLSSPFPLFEVTGLTAMNGYCEVRFHFFPHLSAAVFHLGSAMLALAVPAAATVQADGYCYAFEALAAQLTSNGAGPAAPRCCTESR
ncbi:4'-phosphopantetheinyl transferase family protein [Hymenobacter rubripertinctus]|uniref:4'-phosphopantetheinyl transferase family protein n=1 Tax=Hymenobacter rubripertinctus TaxID=2029981 RepID=UPI0016018DF2|nr:4'-phosphopantetheinyl transferase superfamily protein [Hymenobacter rubripertinctus]